MICRLLSRSGLSSEVSSTLSRAGYLATVAEFVAAVPINIKDRDVFHLTIEEYLLALTNTIEELVRVSHPSTFPARALPIISKQDQEGHSSPHDLLQSIHRLTYIASTYQARLAPNAVTLGDFSRPLQISKFIKDIHAGFQLLNLKNDALRRRSDGIKYSVRPLFLPIDPGETSSKLKKGGYIRLKDEG